MPRLLCQAKIALFDVSDKDIRLTFIKCWDGVFFPYLYRSKLRERCCVYFVLSNFNDGCLLLPVPLCSRIEYRDHSLGVALKDTSQASRFIF